MNNARRRAAQSPFYHNVTIAAVCGPPSVDTRLLLQILQSSAETALEIVDPVEDLRKFDEDLTAIARELRETVGPDKHAVIAIDGFPHSSESLRALYEFGAVDDRKGVLVVARRLALADAADCLWVSGNVPEEVRRLLPQGEAGLSRTDKAAGHGLPGISKTAQTLGIPLRTLMQTGNSDEAVIDAVAQLALLLNITK